MLQGRRKGAVLVHCYAGQSRSVAFVLAYLCAHQGQSVADAYALVLAARPCAKPNAGEPSAAQQPHGTSRRLPRVCQCTAAPGQCSAFLGAGVAGPDMRCGNPGGDAVAQAAPRHCCRSCVMCVVPLAVSRALYVSSA